MKISKTKKVNACQIPAGIPLAKQKPQTPVFGDDIENDPYAQARCYLQSAISALSTVAQSDVIAKESIANLAVVILDLQK